MDCFFFWRIHVWGLGTVFGVYAASFLGTVPLLGLWHSFLGPWVFTVFGVNGTVFAVFWVYVTVLGSMLRFFGYGTVFGGQSRGTIGILWL